MISDTLFEAILNLRDYQEAAPGVYQTVATEVQTVITVMRTLQKFLDLDHLGYPPSPYASPDYREKIHALCESLRGLDLRRVQAATNELMEHVARLGPANKQVPSKSSYLHRGAMVLAEVVVDIRGYQEHFYENLTSEIEVVVTVVAALHQYLDALAQPRSEGSEPSEPVKTLSESLRGLDVGECAKCINDIYDHIACVQRNVP